MISVRNKLSFLFQVLCSSVIVFSSNGKAIHRNHSPLARHLELINESGEKIKVHWVHPITGEQVPYGVADTYGEMKKISLESFVNHTFALRSLSNKTSTSIAANGDATISPDDKVIYITVDDQKDQHYVVQNNLELVMNVPSKPVTNSKDRSGEDAADIVTRCRHAFDKLQEETKETTAGTLNFFIDCLTNKTANVLEIKNENLAFEKDLRHKLAKEAENYTCSDPNMVTSKPRERRTWTYEGVVRDLSIMHERPGSQIHMLHDFISPEECEAIRIAAEPLLHRGTVADGKGGSRMSDNRKAWQAGLKTANWKDKTDPIAAVKRRLFAYANVATGYNMSLDGQEDIMSIQYFGNGIEDTKPDRYTPHCDGDCDGKPHKTGGRVATMVMYCDIPTLGGATNFQQAGVFVKPTLGAGVFFSYMDGSTHIHEEGLTTHSGCPVLEGTKRIAVQWMRVGVDINNPWDSFDTNTVKLETPRKV